MVINQIKLIQLLCYLLASKSSISNSDTVDNGAKDLTSKITKDVQKQLNRQGINIPLPFGG